MQSLIGHALVNSFGMGSLVARCRFVPAGSGTSETISGSTSAFSFGIKTVTRNSAGNWTIALQNKLKYYVAIPVAIENDTTTYHFVRVESEDVSAGTFVVTHKSVAYASVASGPAASDTVDAIEILVFGSEALG